MKFTFKDFTLTVISVAILIWPYIKNSVVELSDKDFDFLHWSCALIVVAIWAVNITLTLRKQIQCPNCGMYNTYTTRLNKIVNGERVFFKRQKCATCGHDFYLTDN